MSEFKPGDVVATKSGGPKMTVAFVTKDTSDRIVVHCQWFVSCGLQFTWTGPYSDNFYADALESAPR